MTERPETASWIAQAIANWSRVDATIATLFVRLINSNMRAAVELYNELESDRAKDAALRSAALAGMSKLEYELLLSQLAAIKTARKTRNKFAHWIWGVCDQVSDGLIAIEPRYMGRHSAEILMGKAYSTSIDLSEIYVFKTSYVKSQAQHFTDLSYTNLLFLDLVHQNTGPLRERPLQQLSQIAHLKKA